MSRIFTSDTEAKLIKNSIGEDIFVMSMISIAYRGEYGTIETKIFFNIKDWLTFFEKVKSPIVYFHNLSFDYQIIVQQAILEQIEISFEDNPIISGTNLIKTSINDIELRDSVILLPIQLKKLVELIIPNSDEKTAYLIDKSLVHDNLGDVSRETLIRYCKLDSKYLYIILEHLKNFCVSQGVKKIPLTVASLSKKLLLKMDIDNKVFNRVNQRLSWFFDENFYFGGRCETFTKEEKLSNVTIIDANSLYPFAMSNIKIHNYPLQRVKPIPLMGLEYFFAEVTIDITEEYRFLPIIRDGVMKFPIGKFKIKICHIDYKFMNDISALLNIPLPIMEVHELLIPIAPSYSDILPQFVSKYYAERLNADNDAFKLFFKNVLNYSYGKFAQKRNIKSYYFNVNPKKSGDKVSTSYIQRLGLFITTQNEVRPLTSTDRLDIAGMITKYSRGYIWYIKTVLNQANCEVLYSDTDSFIIRGGIIPQWLLNERELGKFKIELENGEGFILGNKMYYFTDKKKAHKGMKTITKQQCLKYLNGYKLVDVKNQLSTFKDFLITQNVTFIPKQIEITKINRELY